MSEKIAQNTIISKKQEVLQIWKMFALLQETAQFPHSLSYLSYFVPQNKGVLQTVTLPKELLQTFKTQQHLVKGFFELLRVLCDGFKGSFDVESAEITISSWYDFLVCGV